MTENTRPPKFIESLIPIVVLITLLAFNVYVFSDDATGGPNQIALLLGAVIAAGIGMGQGFSIYFTLGPSLILSFHGP